MPYHTAPPMEEIVESRSLLVSERPITFDDFLAWFGPTDEVELIDGVAQKRTPADRNYSELFGFLVCLLGGYAEEDRLGCLLGCRTAVRINSFRGRLPDVLFVRQENVHRMEQDGLRFAPDLVVEIVIPGDRRSDILAAEVDYRSIGVPEVVFIDQRQRTVRALSKQAADVPDALYDEEVLHPGESLCLDALGGVLLPLDWLFTEPRPTVRAALAAWERPASEV